MDDTERPAAEAIALITAAWHSDVDAATVIITEGTLQNPIVSCAVLAGAAAMFLKIIEVNTSEEHAAELLQGLALATTELDTSIADFEAHLAEVDAEFEAKFPPSPSPLHVVSRLCCAALGVAIVIGLAALWFPWVTVWVGAATGAASGAIMSRLYLRRWKKKNQISP